MVGLNHKTAPLRVRERVSFPKEQLPEALSVLKEEVDEVVILSTCNRTEIYAATLDTVATSEQIKRFLVDFHGLETDQVFPYSYVCTDSDAVRHLFMVASGLDSMIVGESQILGQVRASLAEASESKAVQVALVRLFHGAIRAGRLVREQTDIGRNALSVSYAVVQLAQQVLGELDGMKVLLVGAGEAGKLVVEALRTVGVKDLVIANRTHARGEELAQSLGGRSVPFADIEDALKESDIVIAATDSSELILTKDMVNAANKKRSSRPLFVFDLAIPRDVDPQVGSLGDVRLFDMDGLASIAHENLERRKRAAVQAGSIVEDEVSRFMQLWEELDAIPVIDALHQQGERIRKRELNRALRKMPDLLPEHIEIVDSLTKSIAAKLLHDPTVFLKKNAGKSQIQAARDLFRLKYDS